MEVLTKAESIRVGAADRSHLNLFLASPSVRRPKSLPDPYNGHERMPAMRPPAATFKLGQGTATITSKHKQEVDGLDATGVCGNTQFRGESR